LFCPFNLQPSTQHITAAMSHSSKVKITSEKYHKYSYDEVVPLLLLMLQLFGEEAKVTSLKIKRTFP
jgi:hypothetical protein